MIYQVLIVDDEEIVCRGLAQFVKWKEHGFEVAGTAYSVDEALSLMKKIHIDIVFTDIRMPEKTGLDMLHILKNEYPEVKSVILSGFSDFTYAREAIRYGAVDYLTKPVNLGEVEALLSRLGAEFTKQQEAARIHNNRIEALLLSIARGYAKAEPEKYQLPKLEKWYGLSISLINRELSEDEILQKTKTMKEQISAVVPSAILLNSEVYVLFAIIPYESESEFDSFITILEQIWKTSGEWACGISKFKHGFLDLRSAWQEANQALRYHRASTREGVIFYRNIETLFSMDSPEIQNIITELLCRLNNPETREQVLPWLPKTLSSMQQPGLTVIEFQTLCIRCLIELNGFLQGLYTESASLHARLNEALSQILLCNNNQSTIDCVTFYLQWLIDLLNQSDGHQMGKGVIREIQLFIRQHYNENISLNMLAEQFYLHPNYLSRLFKEKTGTNFVDYLTEIRMEKVKELLRGTDHKVIEICSMVGYDNPRYFSKVFKQNTGMTPRDYREGQNPSSH